MKFLCTKVKSFWLTSDENTNKVNTAGLTVKNPFIGIEINKDQPSEEEYNRLNKAIESLFNENKKVFLIRLIEL